jgi:release factor glutamine methyltransferase
MAEGTRAALAAAVARLRAAGVEDPPGDARRLLAHALGIGADRLIVAMPDTLGPEQAARFAAAIAARAARRPVAQIIGARLFWGLSLRVTPDVLDPRPETEVLVAEALREGADAVLDLGTGSGAIVLAILSGRPRARGVGADISAPALQVAAANACALGLADRVAFIRSDWFAQVAGRFDLIVANPPYLAEAELAGLAPEVARHEPRGALSPGGDGLAAYRRIAAGAGAHLRPGGRILLEIGPAQGQAVHTLFTTAGFAAVRVLPDLDGRDRVVAAVWPADGASG